MQKNTWSKMIPVSASLTQTNSELHDCWSMVKRDVESIVIRQISICISSNIIQKR